MLLSHAHRPKYTHAAWHASKMLTADICLCANSKKNNVVLTHCMASVLSFFLLLLFFVCFLMETSSYLRIKPVLWASSRVMPPGHIRVCVCSCNGFCEQDPLHVSNGSCSASNNMSYGYHNSLQRNQILSSHGLHPSIPLFYIQSCESFELRGHL